MLIQTTDFGKLEIEEESTLRFVKGLFGFEGITEYVLLQYDARGNCPVMCLQSVSGGVSFTVVDPFFFLPDYAPQVSKEDLILLGVNDASQLRYLAVAIVGTSMENTVMNLKSPVLLNPENRSGLQVILTEGNYAQRHPLFSSKDVSANAGD